MKSIVDIEIVATDERLAKMVRVFGIPVFWHRTINLTSTPPEIEAPTTRQQIGFDRVEGIEIKSIDNG